MDETELELMRDQVAATLAAGMIAAERNKTYTPANAARLIREVRTELYPPASAPALDPDPAPEPVSRTLRREQSDNWKTI